MKCGICGIREDVFLCIGGFLVDVFISLFDEFLIEEVNFSGFECSVLEVMEDVFLWIFCCLVVGFIRLFDEFLIEEDNFSWFEYRDVVLWIGINDGWLKM